jgi:hypothetical protein
MDMSVSHFTIEAPRIPGLSSEVIKLDLIPGRSGPDRNIELFDLLDLLQIMDQRNNVQNSLDLDTSDCSGVFRLFDLLKHLAG